MPGSGTAVEALGVDGTAPPEVDEGTPPDVEDDTPPEDEEPLGVLIGGFCAIAGALIAMPARQAAATIKRLFMIIPHDAFR